MKSFFIVLAFILLNALPALAQQPAAKPDWMAYKNPYAGEENQITNPNRTSEEIVTWAQQTAADVLSFGPADYKDKLAAFKKYFVPEGWQLYAAYLKSAKLINKVTEENYSVGAIVTNPPEIVKQGATNGAYRWVVSVPVTISLFVTDPAGKTVLESSGKHTLLVDIARVENGDDSGIAIDSWHVE